MCTLIALHRCTPDATLVVAANRDEWLDRPAERPTLRQRAGGPVVAPLDLRAGGTWLGVNRRGLFAAVTNRPSGSRDGSRRSRGQVVLDALDAPDARAAIRGLEELAPDVYNPMNLFVADAHQAFTLVYEGRPRVQALPPGAHVIGNADPDDREVPKVARLLARAEALSGLPAERALHALASVCRQHDGKDSPLEDTCIHAGGYGTHSSTLLRLEAEPGLWFADGPPCRAAYEDMTPLLHELGDGFVGGDATTRIAS